MHEPQNPGATFEFAADRRGGKEFPGLARETYQQPPAIIQPAVMRRHDRAVPWRAACSPSDPYLMTGFKHKCLRFTLTAGAGVELQTNEDG